MKRWAPPMRCSVRSKGVLGVMLQASQKRMSGVREVELELMDFSIRMGVGLVLEIREIWGFR